MTFSFNTWANNRQYLLLVAGPMQLSNELLEDTRDMAKIWDLYSIKE